jgi:hypothetical protein
MIKKLLTYFMLIVLSACSKYDEVTRSLRDPGSAQFRNVKEFPNGNICGELNQKNHFGAYQGFEIWLKLDGEVQIGKQIESYFGDKRETWGFTNEGSLDQICRRAENPKEWFCHSSAINILWFRGISHEGASMIIQDNKKRRLKWKCDSN